MAKLALLGGEPIIKEGAPEDLFKWPLISKEDEEAVMDIVRNNNFSGTDITTKFQDEFAAWQGRKYAIGYTNGTMSLTAAMFAIGLGVGDEIICPTKTYWGSVSQAMNFGASAVFCNINDDLVLDPSDLERCITPKTKAIMVVHYFGHPCDMDPIMEIANKHNLYVIEDVSHAHGATYKGKKVGNFGHVAAMSMMSWKVFAAGEMGMLVTDDRKIYERAMAFGHYERNNGNFIQESDELKSYFHIALGGVKGRVNQVSAALGRGQLKHFDERCVEIRKAMNYFYDQLEGLPGIRPIRTNEAEGTTMGGFYNPTCAYYPDQLGGLSAKRFAQAVTAEFNGHFGCWEGGNFCLHTHNFFKTFDLLNAGKPGRIVFADRDVRDDDKYLKPSEEKYCIGMPWFKKFDKEWIEAYASVYKKVVENYTELIEGDTDKSQGGRWHGSENAADQQKEDK
ncbi:MAG: aminotransferase class I/II-fold pyridoxal phosphate-dependent enzyme [Clostridia bacterium]|nr:aminotransferase class I/II-fold pyridoxal phosphate-dependent enzyme [Clostridia bacterium]